MTGLYEQVEGWIRPGEHAVKWGLSRHKVTRPWSSAPRTLAKFDKTGAHVSFVVQTTQRLLLVEVWEGVATHIALVWDKRSPHHLKNVIHLKRYRHVLDTDDGQVVIEWPAHITKASVRKAVAWFERTLSHTPD